LAFLLPDVTAVRGLDLIAGTGALGFELASRGAAHVVLVERRADLIARLQALKVRLGAAQVEIVQGDSMQVAATFAPGRFDVVFLDPPFASGLLAPALAAARTLLAAGGLLYVESADPIDEPSAASLGLRPVRAGSAGRVRFHLLQKDGS
jgi:16S rRNA G966 N2-methylase RsmD